MPKPLNDARRSELLAGVLDIIAVRGFSAVSVAEIAGELHCSAATLYRIAPSKESLVLLAIVRWGERALAEAERRASEEEGASDKARFYYRTGAAALRALSPAFFVDVERYESTRLTWRSKITEPYIDRFVELLECAQAAGEIGPVNARFLAEMLRQTGFVVRNEEVLAASGLTREEALMEMDRIVWDGISI